MAKAVAVSGSDDRRDLAEGKSSWQRFQDFLADVRNEMRKVTWPARREVQATTGVVIVTVFLFAVYFWGVDQVLGRFIDYILHLGRK